MAHEVVLTADAAADLDELGEFLLEREGPLRAEQILTALEDVVLGLGTAPTRGAIPKELRALGVLDFRQVVFKPWRIIYRIEGKRVLVLLITDGRQDMQTLLLRRLLRRR